MKTISLIVISLELLATIGAGHLWANTRAQSPAMAMQESMTKKPRLKRRAPRDAKLWGRVEAVDVASRKLTIKDKRGRTQVIEIRLDAKITRGGNKETIPMTGIRKGEKIIVSMSGEKADSVHVLLRSALGSKVARLKTAARK